jgi:hypothetical protein
VLIQPENATVEISGREGNRASAANWFTILAKTRGHIPFESVVDNPVIAAISINPDTGLHALKRVIVNAAISV